MNKKIIAINLMIIFILSCFSSGVIGYNYTSSNESSNMNNYVKNVEKKSYDLLIIAPPKFRINLIRLVNHKNDIGVKSVLKTTNWIYINSLLRKFDGNIGRDKPEIIKYFIKYAYDNWNIKYVLLVGDFKDIPVRYVYNDQPLEKHPEPCFISELYYADIYDSIGGFSSWDTNGNGVYGEWIGDEAQDKNIDLKPEICIGRLPCRNKHEVKVTVNKIISYESNNVTKTDWFKKIIVIGGDTYTKIPGYEGEENTKKIIDNMTDFTPIKLWTSTGTLTGPQDIINAINKGSGFLYLDIHGDPMGFFTYLSEDNKTPSFCLRHMYLLWNRNMLPVCVASSCHNCQFDVHLGNIIYGELNKHRWIPECWGWCLTRMRFGGSIATIGNTGLGYTKEDKPIEKVGCGDYMDSRFFWQYGVNNTEILGEIWQKTIYDYLDNFKIDWNTPSYLDSAIDAKVVQMWVLFGDPSLKIGGYN